MQRLGIDMLHVAGWIDVSGQGGEHDHAEDRSNEHPDAERPQQFGAENSPLVSFRCLLAHGLAHPAAREEDEQIDRQIADHQQGHGNAGHDTGSERHDAHDLGERGFIGLISDFGRNVSSGRLNSRHDRRAPPDGAPGKLCESNTTPPSPKRQHFTETAPAQRLSHTVMPGSNLLASRCGSRRRRTVLRSWSPTARSACQVAKGPSGRISVTSAGIASLAPVLLTSTVIPTLMPCRKSSRTLKDNHCLPVSSMTKTGWPARTFSPTSATMTLTTPSSGARRIVLSRRRSRTASAAAAASTRASAMPRSSLVGPACAAAWLASASATSALALARSFCVWSSVCCVAVWLRAR